MVQLKSKVVVHLQGPPHTAFCSLTGLVVTPVSLCPVRFFRHFVPSGDPPPTQFTNTEPTGLICSHSGFIAHLPVFTDHGDRVP